MQRHARIEQIQNFGKITARPDCNKLECLANPSRRSIAMMKNPTSCLLRPTKSPRLNEMNVQITRLQLPNEGRQFVSRQQVYSNCFR